MIDFASLFYVLLIHLSFIGLGRFWADFQGKSTGENFSASESLFKYWAVGVFFAIVALYLASFLHLYWLTFGVITLLGLYKLIRCYFYRERFSPPPVTNILLLIAVFASCIGLFILYANLSLNHQVHGVSGMGNWALKSKIIFLDSGLHPSYFEHATHYGKFSYPPGLPLINAPLFLINGADQDVILKLNSTLLFTSLFAFISYLFIQNWKWYALPPIVLSLGFFLGDSAWTVTYWLYSEPLLLMSCAVSTMLFIRGDRWSSILSAGGASMIKQEGVLFLLLISLACLLFSKERKVILILIFLSIAPYLSWKFIISLYGINDSDFNFSVSNFQFENMMHAYRSVLECALARWESYSGAITLLPFLLLYCLIRRKWKVFSTAAISLSIIAFYIIAMSFTSIEDIEWHLSATTRYLMLPTIMIFISLSFLYKRSDEGEPNTRI
jgi:hypothetical protein